jgi:hypothetical protein
VFLHRLFQGSNCVQNFESSIQVLPPTSVTGTDYGSIARLSNPLAEETSHIVQEYMCYKHEITSVYISSTTVRRVVIDGISNAINLQSKSNAYKGSSLWQISADRVSTSRGLPWYAAQRFNSEWNLLMKCPSAPSVQTLFFLLFLTDFDLSQPVQCIHHRCCLRSPESRWFVYKMPADCADELGYTRAKPFEFWPASK